MLATVVPHDASTEASKRASGVMAAHKRAYGRLEAELAPISSKVFPKAVVTRPSRPPACLPACHSAAFPIPPSDSI